VQVGVLTQDYPSVSFQQSQSPEIYQGLLDLLLPYVTSPDPGTKVVRNKDKVNREQKSLSFQVRQCYMQAFHDGGQWKCLESFIKLSCLSLIYFFHKLKNKS
jgi:hypothetical protein